MTDNVLSMFDTESASEAGSWLHLVKPGTGGEHAYADKDRKKPLRLKLKGPDSDTWTAFQRSAMRQAGKKDNRTHKEVAEEDADLFARMTLEVENIPGYENPDHAKLVDMYLKYKDIRVQALQYVMVQENFTRKPPKD